MMSVKHVSPEVAVKQSISCTTFHRAVGPGARPDLDSSSVQYPGVFNAPPLVERLSQAVARLLRRRALQRQLLVRARVVQHAQPQDRQPAEAEPGRQR